MESDPPGSQSGADGGSEETDDEEEDDGINRSGEGGGSGDVGDDVVESGAVDGRPEPLPGGMSPVNGDLVMHDATAAGSPSSEDRPAQAFADEAPGA